MILVAFPSPKAWSCWIRGYRYYRQFNEFDGLNSPENLKRLRSCWEASHSSTPANLHEFSRHFTASGSLHVSPTNSRIPVKDGTWMDPGCRTLIVLPMIGFGCVSRWCLMFDMFFSAILWDVSWTITGKNYVYGIVHFLQPLCDIPYTGKMSVSGAYFAQCRPILLYSRHWVACWRLQKTFRSGEGEGCSCCCCRYWVLYFEQSGVFATGE